MEGERVASRYLIEHLAGTGGMATVWRATDLRDHTPVAIKRMLDSLRDNAETRALYPHAFGLTLELRLEPGALAITAVVENRGSQDPMPFSLGLHPYFNVSALEGLGFEGLPERCFNHLTMADEDTAGQLQRLTSGIDLLVRPSGDVKMIDPGAAGGLGRTITLRCSHPLDLAVLWTDPPRPMVCLEPWSGPRLALISGDRRLELAPGANMSLHTRYELS